MQSRKQMERDMGFNKKKCVFQNKHGNIIIKSLFFLKKLINLPYSS